MRQHPEIPDCLIIEQDDVKIIQDALKEASETVELHKHKYDFIFETLQQTHINEYPAHIKGIDANYILGALMNSVENNGPVSPAGNMIEEFRKSKK